MGSGKKKTKSYQKYSPAPWIESGARSALGMAQRYADQPYQPYTGERVAGPSENQQAAFSLAEQQTGAYQPSMERAGSALEGVSTNFGEDFDYQSYMNPFIKGALDPAAREVREDAARRRQDMLGQMQSAGAYGSRAALALRESDEAAFQEVGDLYSQGYAAAFDRGSALWQADQDRKIGQAQGFMQHAGLSSDLLGADFQRLMESGEVQRDIEQQMKDFDYQQFIEARDWEGRNAAFLTDVLRGLKGSYTEEQFGKTTTKTKGGVLGQVLGAGASAVGSYFLGGGSGGGD